MMAFLQILESQPKNRLHANVAFWCEPTLAERLGWSCHGIWGLSCPNPEEAASWRGPDGNAGAEQQISAGQH